MPNGNELYSVQDFARKVKEKYPEYDGVDDYEVVSRVVKKYPEYKSAVRSYTDSDKLVGLNSQGLRMWEGLNDEFSRAGVKPIVKSGFRTAAQQQALYNNPKTRALTKGNDGITKISPHQEGRALDITFSPAQKQAGRNIIAKYAKARGYHVPSDEPWHIAVPEGYAQADLAQAEQDVEATPIPRTPFPTPRTPEEAEVQRQEIIRRSREVGPGDTVFEAPQPAEPTYTPVIYTQTPSTAKPAVSPDEAYDEVIKTDVRAPKAKAGVRQQAPPTVSADQPLKEGQGVKLKIQPNDTPESIELRTYESVARAKGLSAERAIGLARYMQEQRIKAGLPTSNALEVAQREGVVEVYIPLGGDVAHLNRQIANIQAEQAAQKYGLKPGEGPGFINSAVAGATEVASTLTPDIIERSVKRTIKDITGIDPSTGRMANAANAVINGITEGAASTAQFIPVLASSIDGRNVPANKMPLFVALENLRDKARELFPNDPRHQNEWVSSKIPTAFGSGLFYVGVGALTGGVGVGVVGAANTATEIYRDAKESGATEDQALRAFWWGIPIGSSEAFLGIGKLAGSLKGISAGALKGLSKEELKKVLENAGVKVVKQTVGGSVEEGIQESTSGIAINAVAKHIYDKNRSYFGTLQEDLIVGLVTGGLMSGGIATLGHLAKKRATKGVIPPESVGPDAPEPQSVARMAGQGLRRILYGQDAVTDRAIEQDIAQGEAEFAEPEAVQPVPAPAQPQPEGTRLATPVERELVRTLEKEATERREAQREAEIDEPTGLGNTRAYRRALESAEQAGVEKTHVAFDIDGLAAANSVSHAEGNKLIADAVAHLRNNFPNSQIFRTGGDEINVLLDNIPVKQAQAKVQEVVASFPRKKYGEQSTGISGAAGLTADSADKAAIEQKVRGLIERGEPIVKPSYKPIAARIRAEGFKPTTKPAKIKTTTAKEKLGKTAEIKAQTEARAKAAEKPKVISQPRVSKTSEVAEAEQKLTNLETRLREAQKGPAKSRAGLRLQVGKQRAKLERLQKDADKVQAPVEIPSGEPTRPAAQVAKGKPAKVQKPTVEGKEKVKGKAKPKEKKVAKPKADVETIVPEKAKETEVVEIIESPKTKVVSRKVVPVEERTIRKQIAEVQKEIDELKKIPTKESTLEQNKAFSEAVRKKQDLARQAVEARLRENPLNTSLVVKEAEDTSEFVKPEDLDYTNPDWSVEENRILLRNPTARNVLQGVLRWAKIASDKQQVDGAFERNPDGFADVTKLLDSGNAKLQELATDIRDAGTEYGTVILGTNTRVFQHEMFHEGSYLGSGKADVSQYFSPSGFKLIKSHPAWQRIKFYLLNIGGYPNRSGVLIDEAGAHIAENYEQMPIDAEEATDFMHKWFLAFTQRNGFQSLDSFRNLSFEAQKGLELAKQSYAKAKQRKGKTNEQREVDDFVESLKAKYPVRSVAQRGESGATESIQRKETPEKVLDAMQGDSRTDTMLFVGYKKRRRFGTFREWVREMKAAITPPPKSAELSRTWTNLTKEIERAPVKEPVIKEREFPKSAIETGYVEGTDLTYTLLTNRESLDRARELIVSKGVHKAVSDMAASETVGAYEIALGIEAVRIFNENKNVEDEVSAINILSRKLTKAGQAVQAASLIARGSDQSVLIAATRRKGSELSPNQATELKETAQNIRNASERVAELTANLGDKARIKSKRITEVQAKLQQQADKALAEWNKSRGIVYTPTSVSLRTANPSPDIPPRNVLTAVGAARISTLRGKNLKSQWESYMTTVFGTNIAPQMNSLFRESYQTYLNTKKETLLESRKRGIRRLFPGQQFTDAEYRRLITERLAAQTELRREQAKLLQQFNQLDANPWSKAGDFLVNVLGLRRAIVTSLDLSASGRQTKMAIFRHPIVWAKAFLRQIKALNTYQFNQMASELQLLPDYKYAIKFKLPLSTPGATFVTGKEEAFQTRFSEKIPLIKHSEQAYTTMIDWVRMGWFTSYMNNLRLLGLDPDNDADSEQFLKGAKLVANATGRGVLAGAPGRFLEAGSPVLAGAFFSPRFWVSRLQILSIPFNPMNYAKASEPARIEAWKTLGSYVALMAAQGTLLNLAGFDIDWDIDSPDFLKARLGKLHWDMSAGFQNHIRAFLRTFIHVGREKKIFAVPKSEKFISRRARELPPTEIAGRYVRSKLEPGAALVYDVFFAEKDKKGYGTDYLGNPVYLWGKPGTSGLERIKTVAAVRRFAPMPINDAGEAISELGWFAPAAIIPSFFGESVQVYERGKPKAKAVP